MRKQPATIRCESFIDELSKIAGAAAYAKPVLLGAVMGGGAGALTAPRGKELSWAKSGAVIGGLASGPAQVALKRIISRGSKIKELADAEIPHQSPAQLFKWTGIGAGIGAGVTAATGGYKHPDRSSRIGQAADLGVDLGEIALRSI